MTRHDWIRTLRRCRLLSATTALCALATGCAGSDGAPSGAEISGSVRGPAGGEAGVWVIAETNDLPTPFARIVVTDDSGRYLMPDLPKASYQVWVRGYGLVDSPKQEAQPGDRLDLTAVPAPDARTAAYYYPAGYWLSLMEVPGHGEFPGTGPTGNGISPDVRTQADWVRRVKSGGCTACHQLGTLGTRQVSPALGEFPSSVAAWQRRVLSGQAGNQMMGSIAQMGADRAFRMFADWTDRIEAGAVPPAPPRPKGIERNVVITIWDWADSTAYLHDVVSTDRRNPSVNANGPVYGALELSADYTPVLDPRTHTTSRIPLAPRDTTIGPAQGPSMAAPSAYFGNDAPWHSKTNVHNPMLDQDGRLWLTARVRDRDTPAFCREGSEHPSARRFPVTGSGRQLGMYDPRTQVYQTIDTCFGTHHLMFAMDDNNTLWTSGGGPVVGWLNTKQYLETGDEQASQGWTPLILDTNGDGVRSEYVEPDQPVDPARDKRIAAGFYAVAPAPDGSVWASSLGYPGAVIRLMPGERPEETALAEYYELPLSANGEPVEGFSPRGMDVDRNGIAWVALASGHLGSFDRSKCKGPLNGPKATGQHCPEGWTFHAEPLPQLRGVDTPGSAEASYYTWVDWWGALGLGENVPIETGNASEGLLVWRDGEWIVLRVPYPLGFYTKWMDGRIDDPDAGWKGRGVWTTISTRTPFHMEGGQGTTSKVIRFQLRPDPLAR
ncbi:MAG: carboxypeptidase regulatory-like domain-containing protein [Gemmatimonadetes bacterium]|nr:carboxypeptidase regulatory-like domain-containing protein [Gemmatimonadota bacterium]